jgi:hypothetical protein
MKLRVSFEKLDYIDGLNTLDGVPFSGVVYEKGKDGGWDEISIIEGVESGISREWYPSGILKLERHMENNSIHGLKWEWDKEGNLLAESIFEYGIMITSFKITKQGKKQKVYEIKKDNPNYNNLLLFRQRRRSNFFSLPEARK